jgi:hypothetical protein
MRLDPRRRPGSSDPGSSGSAPALRARPERVGRSPVRRSSPIAFMPLVWLAACVPSAVSNEPRGTGGAGISTEPAPQELSSEPEVISCEPWHREPLPRSSAVLVNNTWNAGWANGQPYTQCLLRRATGRRSQVGWRWDWPAYRPFSSYAAPEALYGWKAWDGGASTAPDLPARIDQLASLNVDFDVELRADATHNLNLTMWLTQSDVATPEPSPAGITNEIMVWFSNPANLGGGIPYDGVVTLDGLAFDVWHLENHPDGSGSSTQTWTMMIYASREPHHGRRFDLKLVLDDAVQKGLAPRTAAVGGVELITEVFGGSGELWLNRFAVDVARR